jgi:hypothetical protein
MKKKPELHMPVLIISAVMKNVSNLKFSLIFTAKIISVSNVLEAVYLKANHLSIGIYAVTISAQLMAVIVRESTMKLLSAMFTYALLVIKLIA